MATDILSCNIPIGDWPNQTGIEIPAYPNYVEPPTWIPGPTRSKPTEIVIDPQPFYIESIPQIHTSGFVKVVNAKMGWRQKELEGGVIELACDLPGVKYDDLKVELDDGMLKAHATRADTKENMNRTYWLGDKYDPDSAEAWLSDGVLTVLLKKRPEFQRRRVPVNVRT